MFYKCRKNSSSSKRKVTYKNMLQVKQRVKHRWTQSDNFLGHLGYKGMLQNAEATFS